MTYLQKKKLAFMSIVNSVKGFVRNVSGVPPLTLPDCVDGNSLINYTIGGNSIQNGTPTPDAPVEVESVGEKTVNIFDKDTVIPFGGYIASGKLHDYWAVTNAQNMTFAIPCKPNTTYTVSRQIISARFSVGYSAFAPADDISLTHKGGNSSQSITVTTDDEARYLYVWYYNNAYDTTYTSSELLSGIQIEEGDTPTEYEPYGKYKIPVVCSGKNLFDYNNYFDKLGSVDIDKNIYGISLSVKPDTSYVISTNIPYYNGYVNLFASNTIAGNNITTANNGVALGNSRSITTDGTGTLYVISRKPNSGHGFPLVLENFQNGVYWIQIEEGTTATDYEPYVKPITTNIYLNEPLKDGETLTNPIKLPTVKGTTVYTIDTSIQPTNMSATYYATSKE